MNQKGALLPTALVFLILLTLLLLGTLKIYQNQFEQLQVTKDHYQAKTMIFLTKKKLKEESHENWTKGKFVFQSGEVEIVKQDAYQFAVQTTLKNSYQEKENIQFSEKEQPN